MKCNSARSDPTVSVIMAVKDCARFLPETLASLEAQTLKSWELVAVDDGSTDGSIELIQARLGKRATIGFTGGGKGAAAARNQAIAMSRGRYLSILDSDDVASQGRLLTQINWLDIHNDCLACGAWAEVLGAKEGTVIGKSMGGLRATLIFRNPVVHSTLTLRRSCLSSGQAAYDESLRFAHDYKLIADLAYAGKVDVLPEILCAYRRHETQVSQSYAEAQRRYAISTQRCILRRFEIEPSEIEATLHYRFGHGAGAASTEEMDLMLKWVRRLTSMNQQLRIASAAEWNEIIGLLLTQLFTSSIVPLGGVALFYLRRCLFRTPLPAATFLSIAMGRLRARSQRIYQGLASC